MGKGFFQVPTAINEPIKSYAPGSPEREEVLKQYKTYYDGTVDVPMYIGKKKVKTGKTKPMSPPHDHKHKVGTYHIANKSHVTEAIDTALKARDAWANLTWEQRAAIFLKAAELIAGPYRAKINAATMIAQSKTIHQAEIDADDLTGRAVVPGDLRIVDINDDTIIDSEDRTFLGSPIPDYEYSLSLEADYKGFDVRLFFQGVGGNEIVNGKLFEGVFAQNGAKFEIAKDAWTPSNPSNTIPRATIADPAVNRQTTDFYVEDGSYFRLQNASMGYNFSNDIIQKVRLNSLRVFVNVENAFTIDNYSGYYPVIGRNTSRGDELFNRGVDELAYPTPRTITMGVQLSL